MYLCIFYCGFYCCIILINVAFMYSVVTCITLYFILLPFFNKQSFDIQPLSSTPFYTLHMIYLWIQRAHLSSYFELPQFYIISTLDQCSFDTYLLPPPPPQTTCSVPPAIVFGFIFSLAKKLHFSRDLNSL